MSRTWILLAYLLANVGLLAGCAAPVRPDVQDTGLNTQLPVIPVTPATGDSFEMTGRLAIKQGDTRHHVNIEWLHGPDRDTIFLTGPLGQGIADLSRDARGARLLTADQKEWLAGDWEELGQMVLGLQLPLNQMARWITGEKPASGSGWQVSYLDYQDAQAGALPSLIEMSRGDIEVRLKVDSWDRGANP